ncbi:MAG TPA: hypothetical protein P5217_06025 [Methanoregulaceae archaeon]|nr:hypothetical protein [Methanoregulaceae archaeon]HRY75820.1 hypothetical protein [Methanoregulaceae archaeon]
MPKAEKRAGMVPVPYYAMPDQSEPPYDMILELLQEYDNSLIGSSYFFIREIDERLCLCRIVHGGGRIFFHERVDHQKHGISDEDLEVAVGRDTGSLALPGYYSVSPHIEQKLRVLYDA